MSSRHRDFLQQLLCASLLFSSGGAGAASHVATGELVADDQEDVAPDEAAITRTSSRVEDLGSKGDDVVAAPAVRDIDPVGLWFYGSGRIRTTVSDGELRISDNRSRLGIYGYKFVRSDIEIYSQIELGTDLGGQIDDLLVPPENARESSSGAVFLRVGLVGVGTRWGDFSAGKQWSTYYDVSGYTDRFAVFGATATGTYNAGTDGGGTGTGRSDQALKYEKSFGGLGLALQYQNETEIPQTIRTYDGGIGAKLNYEFSEQWSAGAAYNHAAIDDLTFDLEDAGLNGDATAAIAGVQYTHEPIYVAATYASHKNTETTNELKYIDADGFELYSRYAFGKRWRAIGGVNVLTPDKKDVNAGSYKIRNLILGFQYTYGDITFGDMVYFECELRDGRQVDGTPSENAYTVGVRYSFEL